MNESGILSDSRSTSQPCCDSEALARGLFALAHPARIEILRHLCGVDACCCKDVVGRLRLAQSTVSQHLKVLLDAGLLHVTPEGQRSRYTVDRAALRTLSQTVGDLLAVCAAEADGRGKKI